MITHNPLDLTEKEVYAVVDITTRNIYADVMTLAKASDEIMNARALEICKEVNKRLPKALIKARDEKRRVYE